MTDIQYFFMLVGILAAVGFVLWVICRIIISIMERSQRADIERELERELLKEIENLLKKITDDQEGDTE